ncbi:hypothetical protein SDRG_15703 [Saprolegnia diclina VS20]|uniref:VWFA domain-containing protein n=1 Tax=Saprolegnia diclina (strain VS20) TaxID=1156394 RepID=T0R365_SAPDV|nr:hypothetical protein SDRG_15703 [Saprolegnia diclina VS20]EQC26458.1 hypothetical protein SDRG_15703 [Saprolegnia diclina VS20]|eukprot:XP_008620104.1 hypothetical protein SDRG_15703 [Saprolegnia diclina VS20]
MSPLPLSKALSVSSAAEHKQIASAETAATTFVNCHIVAPPCEESDRKPIDLVVVLDRSGSMSGSKLDLCKQTLDFLAHELSPHDRVSLVTYDTYVTTNLRLTKMTPAGKALLASKVQGVHAGSCTNLSGGLLAGLEEVQSSSRPDSGEPNPVQSVLLLTDGLANAGISSRSGLVELLEGVLSDQVLRQADAATLEQLPRGSDGTAAGLYGRDTPLLVSLIYPWLFPCCRWTSSNSSRCKWHVLRASQRC